MVGRHSVQMGTGRFAWRMACEWGRSRCQLSLLGADSMDDLDLSPVPSARIKNQARPVPGVCVSGWRERTLHRMRRHTSDEDALIAVSRLDLACMGLPPPATPAYGVG